MNREKLNMILDILHTEARLTDEQIAERLGLPIQEVQELRNHAEAERLILGYKTIIHPKFFSKQVRAVIEVKARPERDVGFDRIARKLANFPEVIDLTLISGNYDFLLTVVGENLQEIAEFVSTKLAPIEGIESHATHFILKQYKEAGITLEKEASHERLNITP